MAARAFPAFWFSNNGGTHRIHYLAYIILSLLANVADVKRLVIHPYTTIHSQMTPDELAQQHITPSTVRLSIGIEHIDDIIADLAQALDKV